MVMLGIRCVLAGENDFNKIIWPKLGLRLVLLRLTFTLYFFLLCVAKYVFRVLPNHFCTMVFKNCEANLGKTVFIVINVMLAMC